MKKIIRASFLIILSAAVLFPILYLFTSAFFSRSDWIGSRARFFPSSISLDNLRLVIAKRNFAVYIKNSIITSFLSSSIRTAIIIMAAFAYSHMEFKGKKASMIMLLATLFIPSDALLYQNFSIISKLGLTDTYIGIVLPSLFSASQLLLLSAAFHSLDRSYYDAARIDGSGDLMYITRVLIPLTEAIVMTVFLQSFISAFNSYLWPLLVTNKPRMRTIQIGLSMLGFGESGEKGAEMMSVLLISMPFIIILAISRKWIEKALINSSLYE